VIVDILTVESDIIELIEEGALSWEAVARAGLAWISNYDLVVMAQQYGWISETDEDE
jgi:hypothetical protein|tara:strand:- start:76 stop:246 length:171 start_codon:yes stop_codon:yes gene_type:complete